MHPLSLFVEDIFVGGELQVFFVFFREQGNTSFWRRFVKRPVGRVCDTCCTDTAEKTMECDLWNVTYVC